MEKWWNLIIRINRMSLRNNYNNKIMRIINRENLVNHRITIKIMIRIMRIRKIKVVRRNLIVIKGIIMIMIVWWLWMEGRFNKNWLIIMMVKGEKNLYLIELIKWCTLYILFYFIYINCIILLATIIIFFM